MNENADMKDRGSKEFDEGFEAWCNMKAVSANPYEIYSFEWVEWRQGWKEAAGDFD